MDDREPPGNAQVLTNTGNLDPDTWRELQSMLLRDHADWSEDLTSALATDLPRARRLLHDMKGISGYLGADDLNRASTLLLEILKDNRMPDRDLAVRTANAFKKMKEAITKNLAKPPAIHSLPMNGILPQESAPSPSVRNGGLIMAVDDEPLNLRLIERMLGSDYQVVSVESGSDAMERAQVDPRPDLILLDISMPGMDGHQTIRNLKSSPGTSDIPVIFITADSDEESECKGLDEGAADYLTKPLHPTITRARIRTQLELKRRSDRLGEMARTDSLTGLSNRRSFQEILDRDWAIASRNGWWISIIMVDIDHFKTFNDTWGHLAGDTCLMGVARCIAATLKRSSDMAVRWGGEEFLAFLPDTPGEAAIAIAREMQHNIASLELRDIQGLPPHTVTASFGVASWRPSVVDSPLGLIGQADKALYEAKEKGRNRVISRSRPLEDP